MAICHLLDVQGFEDEKMLRVSKLPIGIERRRE
jgi:hypothetical protein